MKDLPDEVWKTDDLCPKNPYQFNYHWIQASFDVRRFLDIINAQHQEPRKYKCTDDAIETLKQVEKKLQEIDEASNFGYTIIFLL